MNAGLRWLAAIVAITSVSRIGQASSPQAPGLRGQLYAALEFSNTDSRRVDAGGQWYLPEDWEIDLSLSKAEYELAESDVSSSVMGAAIRHDFESFQLGAGFARAKIDDRASTRIVHVTSTYWTGDWRLRAGLGSRDTELGATEFEEDLGGTIGIANGVSRCDARSVYAQAGADWQQAGWSASARAAYYDYRDVDCELTINAPGNGNGNGNGPPAHARGRALGLRLVTSTLESVVGINPRLIPRDAMLLESSIALGAAVSRPSGWQFGGEIYRDVDWLRGRDFFTAVTYGNREIAHNWNMELSLGYATSSLEDCLFAGIRMTASIY